MTNDHVSTDKKNPNSERVPVDVETVLAQREMDLNSFLQQRQHMDALIKMMAKIKESIRGKGDSNQKPPCGFSLHVFSCAVLLPQPQTWHLSRGSTPQTSQE